MQLWFPISNPSRNPGWGVTYWLVQAGKPRPLEAMGPFYPKQIGGYCDDTAHCGRIMGIVVFLIQIVPSKFII
jgi:hypothetical protein